MSNALNFAPMLAADTKDMSKLRFPLLASPKLDGIRCTVVQKQAITRTLKPIPNRHIRELLSCKDYDGFDGELIVGDPTDPLCYNTTNSGVMSHDGQPDFTYYVFELPFDNYEYFKDRLVQLAQSVSALIPGRVNIIYHSQMLVESLDALLEYEQACLNAGYEGLILRDPFSRYKQGRSTFKEHGMLKLKRFQDSEAEIIGVEEMMHNANEAKTNELGRTERSSAKAGMVPKGTLGKFVVRDVKTGVEFRIGGGPGLTAALRKKLWDERGVLMGQTVKYSFFPVGVKEAPRHPKFLGFRDKSDMS